MAGIVIAFILAIFAVISDIFLFRYINKLKEKAHREGNDEEFERKRKRYGTIGAIVTTAAIVVVAIFSFVYFDFT